ncbi:MAG TPA: PP2C family protein-serine/threonine phosphatase [Candidatus Limnocylindrales bacterium]|nr:PP2C family protein-serine/threonine phosphatase [Candidatus Limnocylindrales bacterium]
MPTPEPPGLAIGDRLSALVAPFAAFGPDLVVAVEDGDGTLLAGAPSDRPVVAGAPIGPATAPLGRVVVRGTDAAGLQAATEVLAAALEALVEAAGVDARAVEERTRIEAELALGRRLQRSFVPLVAPDVSGWALASHYEAAREVGGDFFDAFAPRDRRRELAIVMADVTGKGIAAALLMAFARPLIHAAIDHARRPAVALERTNRILVEERRAALFITALCCYLDTRSGSLVVANAGHEPPLIIRHGTTALEEVPVGGPLLGAFPSIALDEARVTLDPGDTLVLYTDGVTDARAANGTRFGDDRFRDVLHDAASAGASARELVDAVVRSVRDFTADEPAADDVTIVVARRLPPRPRVRRFGGRSASPR